MPETSTIPPPRPALASGPQCVRSQGALAGVPRVSVSMLTFNAASFVRDAIESVLSQEVDFGVELIIGDDCSTDGTRDIIREYVARYPHVIRAHLHESHGAGVPGRVNNMHNLNDCRGEYVAMLDGDDYWISTTSLSQRLHFLETHPQYSFCTSDGIQFSPHKHRKQLQFFPSLRDSDVTFDSYIATGMGPSAPSSLMFRRRMLMPLPDWFDRVLAADHYIGVLLLLQGPCRFLGDELWAYRVHGASFSAAIRSRGEGYFRYFDDYVQMRRLIPGLSRSKGLDSAQIRMLIFAMVHAVRDRDLSTLAGVGRRLRTFPPLRVLRLTATGIAAEAWRRARYSRKV